MSQPDDLQRLRAEYADREQRYAHSDRYSLSNPGHRYMTQARHHQSLDLLQKMGITRLEDLRLLELGCGKGEVLQEYLSAGVSPANLYGCDLLPARVIAARQFLPQMPLVIADGQNLPYADDTFDLVLQYTVFSSILDAAVKRSLAVEMLRVLRPGGLVLWYDFWLNPTNPQTRGIRPEEIRQLFPGCKQVYRKITLAPPISRQLVRLSIRACRFLERLKLFNTHYLVAIQKP